MDLRSRNSRMDSKMSGFSAASSSAALENRALESAGAWVRLGKRAPDV